MAELEDVLAALRKADEAGNTEDAQRLAQIARDMQSAAPARPEIDIAEGMGRAAVHGGMFGFGDEVVAGGVALRNELGQALEGGWFDGWLGGTVDRPMSEVYNASLNAERDRIDQFRDESPVLAYGSEIAGAIPSALAGGGLQASRALQGNSLLARMGGEGLVGAGQGLIYGAGAGEGGFQNRATEGLLTAAMGGALGAFAPAIGAAGGNVLRRVTDARRAQFAGTSGPVSDAILPAVTADNLAPGGGGAARLDAAGPNAMLADAGPATAGVLDGAMSSSGDALALARRNIDTRLNAATQSVTDAMDNAFGAPAGVREISRTLRDSTATVRGDTYRAAYAQPIDYASDAGMELEDILTRVPERYLKSANEMIAMEREPGVKQILAKIGDDGTVEFVEMPTVQQLDYLTRALRREADTMKRAGDTTGARLNKNLVGDIRDILKDMIPEYKEALGTAADVLGKESGLELGYDAMRTNMTAEAFGDEIARMSDGELSFVRQGIRAYIDDTLANTRRTLTNPDVDQREALKAINQLSTRAARDKITAALGDADANALFASLDEAAMAFELQAAVARNSATAARLAMENSVKENIEGGVAANFKRGEPLGFGQSIWQNLTGGTPAAAAAERNAVMAQIAELLTGPQGPAAMQVFQGLIAPTNPGTIGNAVSGISGLLSGVNRGGAAPAANQLQGLITGQ